MGGMAGVGMETGGMAGVGTGMGGMASLSSSRVPDHVVHCRFLLTSSSRTSAMMSSTVVHWEKMRTLDPFSRSCWNSLSMCCTLPDSFTHSASRAHFRNAWYPLHMVWMA